VGVSAGALAGALSYTIELGPPSLNEERGIGGFVVPSSQIWPVCQELADGIDAFMDFFSDRTASAELL